MKEWLYGRRTVGEHLKLLPQSCEILWIAEGASPDPEILELARRQGVPVERKPRAEIERKAAGANHQGVALLVGELEYSEPEELVARLRAPGVLPLIFALDCVQDPRNLGAVIRVADGVKAAGVIVPKDRSAGLTAAAARSAAGAAASVPVARVTNLARTLRELKDEGVWTLGAAAPAQGGEDFYKMEIPFPVALVLGAEGEGLRPNVAKTCDRLAALPMRGAVSSLNVGVAAAVFAYEFLRRRG